MSVFDWWVRASRPLCPAAADCGGTTEIPSGIPGQNHRILSKSANSGSAAGADANIVDREKIPRLVQIVDFAAVHIEGIATRFDSNPPGADVRNGFLVGTIFRMDFRRT